MKKTVISIALLSTLHLSAVTLEEIVTNAKQPQLINKTIDAEQLAFESANLAQTETAPLTYNQSLSQNRGAGESGFEYEVSFSKEFKLGNIRELEGRQSSLNNEAYLLEQKREIYRYNAYLKNTYHNYCLDEAYLASFREEVDTFIELYNKKERAYSEDEISKTELLQLRLEKQRLESQLMTLSQKQEDAKAQLLSLTTLDRGEHLFCQDIYPIQEEVFLDEESFSLTQEAYNKRIESTQVGLKRYSQKIESIDVSMGYTKELDRDIYTMSISIPLNFSTHKSEYERASLLHQSSVLSLKNQQIVEQRVTRISLLQKRLKQNYHAIEAQKEIINNYTSSLLPLIKKSYQYGESSVIEYLLSEQKLYGLKQELLEKKRGYYETLFKLYSMSESKDI